MTRTKLLTAAAALSAAIIGSGCEQQGKSTLSTTTTARTGSAHGETMQATNTAAATAGGADRSSGTSASGVTTGNVTTGGGPASVDATAGTPAASGTSSSSSSSSASGTTSASAGGTSPTAAGTGQGPGEIDQQNTSAAASGPGTTTDSFSLTARSDATGASAGATSGAGEQPKVHGHITGTTADASSSDAAAQPSGTDASATATATGTGATTDAAASHTAAAGAAASGVGAQAAATAEDKGEHKDHADAVANVKPAQAAPAELQVTGTVKFMKAEHGVKVMVDLKGLTPNGQHGFHIHEKGDLSDPKLTTAGPHFNPGGKKHGGPEGEERHGGDLGNLTADDKGNVKAEIMAHGLSIDGEKDGIIGRSVIVHAKPDDLKSDPSGNSGDRVAGGKIEKGHGEGKSADAGTVGATGAAPANTTSTPQPKAATPDDELNK